MADALPMGRTRRDFWADYYFDAGPRAVDGGEDGDARDSAATALLDDLLARHLSEEQAPATSPSSAPVRAIPNC